jgi:hypothetical protein
MDEQEENRVISEVSSLLATTETAHGLFEAEALNGQRDEEWPQWYAQFLIQNGLPELLNETPGAGKARSVEQLAGLLAEADISHKATAPNERWQDYYARYLMDTSK